MESNVDAQVLHTLKKTFSTEIQQFPRKLRKSSYPSKLLLLMGQCYGPYSWFGSLVKLASETVPAIPRKKTWLPFSAQPPYD